MLAYFIDFISQLKKILKRLRLVVRIAKQGSGVKCSHHENPVLFNKLAMLLRYLEIGTDKPLSGNSTDTNYNFRAHKPDLLSKPRDASALLLRLGITIVRRSAFNHVGDVNILSPVQPDCVKVFIEKLTAPADKRFTLEILLLTRTFADEENLCFFISDAENKIGSRSSKLTFVAVAAVCFQLIPIVIHRRTPLHLFLSGAQVHRRKKISFPV